MSRNFLILVVLVYIYYFIGGYVDFIVVFLFVYEIDILVVFFGYYSYINNIYVVRYFFI